MHALSMPFAALYMPTTWHEPPLRMSYPYRAHALCMACASLCGARRALKDMLRAHIGHIQGTH